MRSLHVSTAHMAVHALLVFGVGLATAGCLDVRNFAGSWTGPRVGDSSVLRRGIAEDANATLVIEHADLHSLSAQLTVPGIFEQANVLPVPEAEADVLASISFDGAPARVYLSFVETQGSDDHGNALVVISLHAGEQVFVRAMRGGSRPLYGIFALRPTHAHDSL